MAYFSKSPLGSICLKNWSPENFILNSVSKKVQLNIFDQLFSYSEPSCNKDKDCFVDGINCGELLAFSLRLQRSGKKRR